MQRKILNSISKWIGFKIDENDFDKRLMDFDLDSLSLIELIMYIEEEFDIYIDIDDVSQTPTIKEVVTMAINSLEKINKG